MVVVILVKDFFFIFFVGSILVGKLFMVVVDIILVDFSDMVVEDDEGSVVSLFILC